MDNDRAEEWNNAYSLWLAREHFAAGALLVNGDTVHPVSVEKTLLAAGQESAGQGVRRTGSAGQRAAAAAPQPGIVIAVDDVKRLADEEMKVIIDSDGRLTRITKLMDPALAYGEYIGATLIGAPPRRRSRRPSRRPGAGIPRCTTRTASRNSPTAAARSGWRPSARSSGWRSTTTTTCAGPARSPLAADGLGRAAVLPFVTR